MPNKNGIIFANSRRKFKWLIVRRLRKVDGLIIFVSGYCISNRQNSFLVYRWR